MWIALAAVVVLGVGTTATLAVVRPWEGDTSNRDVAGSSTRRRPVRAGRQRTGGADADDADDPDDPDDPYDPPPPTSPAGPVTADLDGNGYGDAVAVFESGDGIERVVLSSTGRSFEVARQPAAGLEDRTWADFDGDGELDQVSWTYELGGKLNLTSEDLDFREINLRLRLDASSRSSP